ncbi:MAG: hypothetical protein ICV60_14010 [Pyrinomonadaceae bacterium]|nr:hypothetical protein [Pyrinomonadaceae bacterium]
MSHIHLRSVMLLLLITLLSSSEALAQSSSERDRIMKEIESLQEQVKAKEKVLLAPAREDAAPYEDFLNQPGTGLIRLLPREKYDGKLLIRGGGAYYSFASLKHEYGQGSDIELQQNSFSVGFAGADFGYLCLLGEVPLQEVGLDHAGAQFLLNYAAPSAEPEARQAAMRARTDFQANNYVYKDRLPVQVGSTYLLRSISYGDSDTLVAFRVLRKDSDGSVILLWKMLKKFPKPQLQRDKTAKM